MAYISREVASIIARVHGMEPVADCVSSTRRKQSQSRKWGKAKNHQSPLPGTSFLQQGSASWRFLSSLKQNHQQRIKDSNTRAYGRHISFKLEQVVCQNLCESLCQIKKWNEFSLTLPRKHLQEKLLIKRGKLPEVWTYWSSENLKVISGISH